MAGFCESWYGIHMYALMSRPGKKKGTKLSFCLRGLSKKLYLYIMRPEPSSPSSHVLHEFEHAAVLLDSLKEFLKIAEVSLHITLINYQDSRISGLWNYLNYSF